MSVTEKLGVYVSVPFCRAKCSFCNFASGVSGDDAIERYVEMLCGEIRAAGVTAARVGARLPRVVDTVYFGGGTPSLLSVVQLRRVFEALRSEFEVERGAEITLEAAPGQIADEVLEAAMRLGVNRLSLGVQSFVDRESVAVGRSHTRESCVAEIRRLRAAGIAEVGADLIAGLPYQTLVSWEESLQVAGELAKEGSLTHLSVYMLEIDEDSRLGREVLSGGLRIHAPAVCSDELAAEMYERACLALPSWGLEQYEISNFALRGSQSRHNRKYWERAPYLGFGLDAHSMLRVEGRGSKAEGQGDVRFANEDELSKYEGAFRGEPTLVGETEALEERVFLGLRLSEGVVLPAEVAGGARELVREGLMWFSEGRFGLTTRGRLVSNEVFGSLLEAVAA